MARATFRRGAKVDRWLRNLESPAAALKKIGALMAAESQAAFRNQSFGDKPWAPRSDVNVFGIIADFAQGRRQPPQRRFEKRPALQDTGRLAASITFRMVDPKTVEVGSNLPYAGVHHRGGKVESQPISERVRKGLWKWLKKQDKGLKRRLGWILNRKFAGKTLTMEVPARPIVGITKQTIADVREAVGVSIMEAR
jgi:phage gpG-like protein